MATATYTISAGTTSDSFSGTGSLSSNWTSPVSGFTGVFVHEIAQAAGVAVDNYAWSYGAALYSGTTFPNDQYAQVTVQSIGPDSGVPGICVRATVSGNGYCWGWASPSGVAIVQAGVSTYATSCTAPTAGQTMKLGVHGSTVTCYVNGVEVGSFTDTTLTSGSPAILISNGSTSGTSGTTLSNFSAGAN